MCTWSLLCTLESAVYTRFCCVHLSLIVVPDEAKILVRSSFGLDLVVQLMKIWPVEDMDSELEAPLMRSVIGGCT